MITREKALEWWNSISNEDKTIHCLDNYDGRRHSSLTGREIEGIWGMLGKPIPNEALNSFCTTCGIGDHTSSECPFVETYENINNAGALG